VSGQASSGRFPKWDWEHEEYPKTLARDDFWGQIRRTIKGRRITEEEVTTLVDHLRELLELRPSDVLLDLCCGNGALSARLFDGCAGCVGADLSPYLIEIAKEYFERPPAYVFFYADAAEFAASVERPESFTKILCYGAFQYLSPATVDGFMRAASQRFPSVRRVVLGNLPDRDRARRFFREGYTDSDLGDHQSQIGRWWSADEVRALGARFGWEVATTRMSEDFFNAEYRFDAILIRT
jgi:cyclopropane fatty-acyl-phospholipid synthase-like methyltransferase